MSRNRFVGDENFVWWLADVEDVMDPEKLGRVRIRIDGYHDSSYRKEDLPWATPISPIQSASLHYKPLADAVGISPTGIEVGSWVFGFWADHNNTRSPIIVGTIAAHRFDPPEPPKNKSQTQKRLHDVHQLAREVNIWDSKKEQLGPEPKTTYGAKYPENKVISTKKGHVIEMDDTPGVERLHVYHKSGTYIEVSSDGRTVTKVVGNNYVILAKDDEVYVAGNVNIVVKGNVTLQVDKNVTANIGGNLSANVAGHFRGYVGNTFNLKIKGTCDIESGGNMQLRAPRIDLN